MVNEKLVNDDVFAILEQLCIVEFGEPNILIYNEQGGLAVVVDMGAFYHLRRIGDMITYEESIPAKSDTRSSLLCSYHIKDFGKLDEDQKQLLLDHHYRNLLVKDPEQL